MIAERDSTRERFLIAIADKVNREAVAEAHFFQPIKQGLTESGVAVIAVNEGNFTAAEGGAENSTGAEGAAENSSSAENSSRLAIHTARYRLTLKGPERGKWDFSIQAEADAPLVTVEKVVQGVQRRTGDAEGPEKISGEEFRTLLASHLPSSAAL
jgi:hypothetical protein